MARHSHRSIGLLVAAMAWGPTLYAGHIIGAEVDLHFVSNDQYEVRLTLWRDCMGVPMASTESITYRSPCDSGAVALSLVPALTEDVTNLCAAQMVNSTCNGGTLPGVERYVYTGFVDLPPCDAWTVRWQLCCVSGTNMNTGSMFLVARTTLNNAALPCRDSPRFEGSLVPILCAGSVFSYDPLGRVDGPGDVRYSLVSVVDENDDPGVYAPPYSGTVPYPAMTIDSITGRIEAPASNLFGGFVISARTAVKDPLGTLLGAVERVFILNSIPCYNARPAASSGAVQLLSGQAVVISDRSLELWPGESFCIETEYIDPNAGDTLTISHDIAQVLTGSTYNVSGNNPATANFCLTAPLNASGVYHFVVAATDEVCQVMGVQQYLYRVRILPDTLDGCSTVSVLERDLNAGLDLFPNPGTGQFTLRWSGGAPSPLHLNGTDAQGRAVPLHWERMGADAVRVEIARAGLVYLRWSDGRNSGARTVLVQEP